MDTLILATKGCSHGPMLERELQKINVNYRVQYIEDDPDDVIKYQIRNTPNLIVNDSIVFRGSPQKPLPSNVELKRYFK
jgi:glutaredoxin